MEPLAGLVPIEVELDGRRISHADLADTLLTVRVRQRLSLPAMAELVFAVDQTPLPASRFEAGQGLRVVAGAMEPPLFEGEVTAVEHVFGPAGQREVQVRGYDPLHRLQKQQAIRAYVDVTLPELARQMVADLGISVEAAEAGPLWHRVIQHRESNLALLHRLGARSGLYLSLRGRTLHVLSLDGLSEAPTILTLGDTLLEARGSLTGAVTCGSVTAAGWSPARVTRHEGRAAMARSGRTASAAVSATRVGATGERQRVDEIVQDDLHAEALARAELDARVARTVTLVGVAEGHPRLRPGGAVEVVGLGAPFEGRYTLTGVTHSLDTTRGYVSELETSPPPPPPASQGAVVLVGEVRRTDDPEGLGRVQVSLPTCGDVEADWMGVLVPGAGAGKGMLALPEVGDTVLVLCVGEDPAQGVVLGGLYGELGLPGEAEMSSGGEGVARPYTFLTPGGQRVRLDDAKQTLRLENSAGSYVELSLDALVVHAVTDLTIEAPGRTLTLRGNAINLDQG